MFQAHSGGQAACFVRDAVYSAVKKPSSHPDQPSEIRHVFKCPLLRRLAKIIVPTFKALELMGKEPPAGRGGMVHRYVQQMVMEGARKKGYRADVENDLGNGGICDVHLEKGGQRVAVEVAVVSKPEREVEHIKRCLDAGYDRVFDIFADERLLVRTQEEMTGLFSDKEMARVRLLPLKKLEGFF